MSSTVIPEAAQDLIEQLTVQRECYEEFSALSQEQLRMIDGGQAEALLALLARKQKILARIDRTEQKLAPLKRQWPCLRENLSLEVRRDVEAAIDRVGDALARVIELERQSEQQLCRRKEVALDEVRRTAQGRQVHNAYGGVSRPTGHRYLDTTDGT